MHFPLIRTSKYYYITAVSSTIPIYPLVCRASLLLDTWILLMNFDYENIDMEY